MRRLFANKVGVFLYMLNRNHGLPETNGAPCHKQDLECHAVSGAEGECCMDPHIVTDGCSSKCKRYPRKESTNSHGIVTPTIAEESKLERQPDADGPASCAVVILGVMFEVEVELPEEIGWNVKPVNRVNEMFQGKRWYIGTYRTVEVNAGVNWVSITPELRFARRHPSSKFDPDLGLQVRTRRGTIRA
jgi:hypothetical protein